MNLKFYALLFALSSLIFVSCKTAKKLYEKGDYTEAVERAAKKLQKDPNDPKLLDIITNAYAYAVNDHENRIRNYADGNGELKWENMYNEYASLQRMYDAIYKAPSVFSLVKPVDYSSYLVTYAQKAGEVRFERGMNYMRLGQGSYTSNKQNFRNAFREFQAAQRFLPGDMEVEQQLNEAYEYAVTNVVILPIQQTGGYVYSSYTVGGNNLDDQILRNLQFNSGNEFVKYYSAWDARSKNIRVDQEVDLEFSDIDLGRYHDNRSSRKVSKEVVVKETVYKPDSIVREYAKVYAVITTVNRTINSSATLRISVRDAQGGLTWRDWVSSNYNWCSEFSTYTGDIRALDDGDKQLVERRREFEPPNSEIMRQLTEQISNDAQYRLRNYLSSL